ncbi:hypothetical protein GV792_02605 [Nocardia cyriacigeorgica]|uniref:hypothetical protein n=1 Tax=Nocardia cyriacigeorgica TaxID=135487 RepID=UPI0013BCCAA4|nr:hypothetical protein [Nocardia cyriacigeorgica]NEW48936.1 hypothetical protein [Nocardia cyriacigeorgica]
MTGHIHPPTPTVARRALVATSGFVAFWAITGAVGLTGGGADLNRDITEELPFESPAFAGIMLLVIVGIPMTLTCAMAVSRHTNTPAAAVISGLTLVGWVCAQPVIIGQTHWLQLVFGVLGVTVALLSTGMREHQVQPITTS